MRELKILDYVFGTLGIIGALSAFGVLGKSFFVLLPLIWLISTCVVASSLVVLTSKWLANILTPSDLRRYLFYAFTNALPSLAIWIAYALNLKLEKKVKEM